MKLKKIYADIAKIEDEEDGTIKVWGYASTDGQDSDGETITADAMKAALPDYMKWGAVREMHQPKAAGTAIEAEVGDDGKTWFGAHIVDSEAVKKVKANVYKGFSIGGKVTSRDELQKTTITGLRLVEVSLVDRPANPEAVITVMKAEDLDDAADAPSAVDQLADLLNKGEITAERLLELAKGTDASADGAADPAPADDKMASETADDLQKGMYGVSRFASVLYDLSYICSDAEWESQNEGDNSPIPAALRDWLAQGLALLQAMTKEECDELVASLQASATATAKAAGTDDLRKAGARYSKQTKAVLKAAHDACRAADKALADLGYDKDGDDDSDKSADVDDLRKVADAHDAIVKACAATGCPEGAIVADWIVKLGDRVKELEAQPAPGKALLKAIEKGQDVGDAPQREEVAPVRKADGSIDDAATLLKKIHATGGARVF